MTRITTSPMSVLAQALALLAASACTVGEPAEELDPAGALGDEEMSDEGPLEPEPATPPDDSDFRATLRLQLPFPCGQVWAGQTRTAHSPQNSVDFNRSNDTGDTVVAAARGTVTRVANEGNTSYGRWVEINHGDGHTTRYAHLSVQSVSVGQVVTQGQKIGAVGTTGGSTGPHLHYEHRRNGVAVRTSFNGVAASYFATRNYTSQNGCGVSDTSVVGRVNTNGAPLSVRSTASTSGSVVRSVADGAQITITCQKRGSSVTGTYGSSTLWDQIGGGFVADAFVSTGSDGQVAPDCP